jgi:hypothetical protein
VEDASRAGDIVITEEATCDASERRLLAQLRDADRVPLEEVPHSANKMFHSPLGVLVPAPKASSRPYLSVRSLQITQPHDSPPAVGAAANRVPL